MTKAERPEYGRSYQTPFADRIRNEVTAKHGVSVIAVGAISSWDDMNSILLAGRADMCALGRSHLYDPRWTLHAAAEQEYFGVGALWPLQFRAVAASLPPRAPRRFALASSSFARTMPLWTSLHTCGGSRSRLDMLVLVITMIETVCTGSDKRTGHRSAATCAETNSTRLLDDLTLKKI